MKLVSKITVEVLEKHAKYLRNEEGGERLVSVAGNVEIVADLRGANLSHANLRGANLSDAKSLDTVKTNEGTAFFAMQCPGDCGFIGWKKCKNSVIVKLSIPANARRSSATTRKCRAEFADVIEVFGAEFGVSQYDDSVVYKVGERVTPKNGWDENRWAECSSGIHFFITRREAEQY